MKNIREISDYKILGYSSDDKAELKLRTNDIKIKKQPPLVKSNCRIDMDSIILNKPFNI